MPHPTPAWRKVIKQPRHFTWQVVRAFQKNQGLLPSGALAYYRPSMALCGSSTKLVSVPECQW